jgi:hypothetical protein
MSRSYLASINERTAFLFTDFGERMARQWFGDAAVEALPKFTRGKHAGKPKGVLVWRKVERGGWVRTGSAFAGERGPGYVEQRVGQIIDKRLCEQAPYGAQEPYGRTVAQA